MAEDTAARVGEARRHAYAAMRARPEAWSDEGRLTALDLYEEAIRADERARRVVTAPEVYDVCVRAGREVTVSDLYTYELGIAEGERRARAQ